MDSQIVFLLLLINISIIFSVFFQFVCSNNFNLHLPLYPGPISSGVHFLYLSFGTPPQGLLFVMDTGNSLVYFQCTDDSSLDSMNNSTFPCNSTQCNWFHPHQKCELKSADCPDFQLFSLLSENLTFPETSFGNFIAGCTNDYHPDMLLRIAGFGRAPYSLPAQMELDSFSYCLLSHDLYDDDKTNSSDLVLITKGGSGGGGSNGNSAPTTVQYTPLIPNPELWPDYYYVRLQNITVGNVTITVPDNIRVPDNRTGDGGTIVNSGTPYNFMEESVFGLVAKEFMRQIIGKNINNIRNRDAEDAKGFGLCFNVASFDDIPKLSLHFDGGAVMLQDLPFGNYFKIIANIDERGPYYVVCMMTKTGRRIRGPTIVLGNYVQQNFYIQFDLKNNRLGILNHTCTQK